MYLSLKDTTDTVTWLDLLIMLPCSEILKCTFSNIYALADTGSWGKLMPWGFSTVFSLEHVQFTNMNPAYHTYGITFSEGVLN